MSSRLHINISEPCHENWQQMTPNEQGRHCMACQKTIVDFTLMSDQEILKYISTASIHVCGRFNNDQLDKVYSKQQPLRLSRWRYAWNMVVATFLLTGHAAMAQTKKAPVKKVNVIGHKLVKIKRQKIEWRLPSEILLKPNPNLILVTMGFTVTTEKLTMSEKFMRAVEFWLPSKEITINASPVIPGGSFSVNLQLKQLGTYRIELTDADGKRVHVQLLQVEQEQQTLVLATEPAWRRGTYLLRVTHTIQGKEYQTKVLLQ